MKRCYTCESGVLLPAAMNACPDCGGHAFFYGRRMTRVLWPRLRARGRDTLDGNGIAIEGEWDRQMSLNREPRWRRT